MSVQCPVCQNSLEEDFGLVICGSCGASLFIEIDGEIRASSTNSNPTPHHQFSSNNEDNNHFNIELSKQENEEALLPFDLEEESSSQEMELVENEILSISSVDPENNLSNMKEVADFGNSQESVGREGPLRVRVIIEGIDSPELRDEIKEALIDKKFLWDEEEIMRQIHGGQLIIESLTPLKASIFIERIKHLPLDVKWEQFSINQI